MHADAPGDGGALLAAVLLVARLVAVLLVAGLGADLGHVVAHAATPGQTLVVIAQGKLFNDEVGQQGRLEGQTAQSVDLGADDISLVASLLSQADVPYSMPPSSSGTPVAAARSSSVASASAWIQGWGRRAREGTGTETTSAK